MDHFDQIAAGVRPPAPLSMRIEADHLSPKELELSYAIAKKLPDMVQRGFTIETSYGETVIEPGRHAHTIAATVRHALEIQLKAAEQARRDTDLDGALA